MTTTQYLLDATNWSPFVIGACIAAAVAYGVVVRARVSARAWYFAAALAVIVIAIGSPVNALASGYLFSAHMVQHMLLLLIAPLLLVLGVGSVGARVHPAVCWIAGVGAMWVWHDRTLCELATTTRSARVVQILSLLALGILFWSPVVARGVRTRLSPLGTVAYLFAACVACSVLGILITFAPGGVVCPAFSHPPDHASVLHLIRTDWGLTPDRDQQVGGLVMWVPGCGIYLLGVMAVLARWYRAAEGDANEP